MPETWSNLVLFDAYLAGLPARVEVATMEYVKEVAYLCEAQAKINASSGSHPRGTPTPASKGSGPAVVSGTLRRSIRTFGPHREGFGFEASVGPTVVYGRAVEIDLDYPYLGPAAEWARRLAPTVAQRAIARAVRGR